MANHRWTDADVELLYEMNDKLVPLIEQAQRIGTTAGSVGQYRTLLGINFGTANCLLCKDPIQQNRYGRKKRICSESCRSVLNQAYVTHARIEGRDITNCLNCGGKLIPPWTTKKKWCSRACSHRGWYTSAYYGGQKVAMKDRTRRSMRRRRVVQCMTQNERDALMLLREDGRAPRYWMEKLRHLLECDSNADLVRYARAIRV